MTAVRLVLIGLFLATATVQAAPAPLPKHCRPLPEAPYDRELRLLQRDLLAHGLRLDYLEEEGPHWHAVLTEQINGQTRAYHYYFIRPPQAPKMEAFRNIRANLLPSPPR